jgi:hypothetical protein
MPPSPELLLSLSPSLLRSLLATFGPVRDLSANATPTAIAHAIFDRRSGPKLSRALARVARFGTASGRRAIVEAARARRDARAAQWNQTRAADVAARLVIECATLKGPARRAAERILALATLRLERELAERPTYELCATTPVDAAAIARALAGVLEPIDVWTFRDPDGSARAAVFRRGPRVTWIDEDTKGLVAREAAPVVVDLLRVLPGGVRVALTLAAPEDLPAYARALGLSLLPSLSLRPFHDLTADRLARAPRPRGVQRVTVVGIRRRKADGTRAELRGFDALAAAEEGGALGGEGYVDRTTVRTEHRERAVDAFLELPHRIEISDPEYDAPVREALGGVGIFAPGTLQDDARSLAPYTHADWRWRRVVGDDAFERLVATKRLVRALAAHVATEEHRMHGSAFIARDVPGEPGMQYALSEDRSLGAKLVGPKDRVAWRLDLAALAAAMRADLGASPVDPSRALDLAAVLDLGVVALPSGKLRFVYPMGTPPKGWAQVVARASGLGVTPIALLPRGHGGAEGMIAIDLDVAEQLGARRIGRALGKAAEAVGAADEVEAWRLHDEDVVIDEGSGRVWVAGTPVALTEKPLRLLTLLARRAGQITPSKEIGMELSSSGYPDVAARKAKAELERQVRAAGLDDALIGRLVLVDGRKGFRIGLSARVVSR